MKLILLSTVILILVSCNSGNDKSPGEIYDEMARSSFVPVHFTTKSKDGGFGGEWIGKMTLSDWDTLKNGNCSKTFILLTECYFVNDKGEKIKNSESKNSKGIKVGYSDQVLLNVSSIFRIIPAFTSEFDGAKITIKYNDGIGL